MITKICLTDIPTEIAQLPVRLPEKLALHFIDRCPDITNERLAQLLGILSRGVQDMLRRLRQLGYVVNRRKGRARRLELMFPVERHANRDVLVVELGAVGRKGGRHYPMDFGTPLLPYARGMPVCSRCWVRLVTCRCQRRPTGA